MSTLIDENVVTGDESYLSRWCNQKPIICKWVSKSLKPIRRKKRKSVGREDILLLY